MDAGDRDIVASRLSAPSERQIVEIDVVFNIIYCLAMWSVEVSIQTPIAIFSSQDNNWTIGRNFYLSQLYCQPQASQHAQCGACCCHPHSQISSLTFSVFPTKNKDF